MTLTEQDNKILKAFVGKDEFDFDNFLRVLFGQEGMYNTFESLITWGDDWNPIESRLSVFLFHPDHHARFLRLFLDFLALEETQREFGWEKCPECGIIMGDGFIGSLTIDGRKCSKCDGTGKLPRPWLRAMKEGKE